MCVGGDVVWRLWLSEVGEGRGCGVLWRVGGGGMVRGGGGVGGGEWWVGWGVFCGGDDERRELHRVGRRQRQVCIRERFEFKKMAPPLSKRDDDGITVILTAYRRVEYLAEQIKAIRAQTRAPLEIWVWTNASPDQLVDISALADRVVVSNTNWLFRACFALGNLARTVYVAFFE